MDKNKIEVIEIKIPCSCTYLFVSKDGSEYNHIIRKYYSRRDGGCLSLVHYGFIESQTHKAIEQSTGKIGYFMQLRLDICTKDNFDKFCKESAKIIYNEIISNSKESDTYKENYYIFLENFIYNILTIIINK